MSKVYCAEWVSAKKAGKSPEECRAAGALARRKWLDTTDIALRRGDVLDFILSFVATSWLLHATSSQVDFGFWASRESCSEEVVGHLRE